MDDRAAVRDVSLLEDESVLDLEEAGVIARIIGVVGLVDGVAVLDHEWASSLPAVGARR